MSRIILNDMVEPPSNIPSNNKDYKKLTQLEKEYQKALRQGDTQRAEYLSQGVAEYSEKVTGLSKQAFKPELEQQIAQAKQGQVSPTTTTGVYEDKQGRRYSIAPEIAERQQIQGVFTNEKGQGFSAMPSTVPVKVRDIGFGKKEVTYADNSKKVVTTGTIDVYGKEKDVGAAEFKRESRFQKIIKPVKKAYTETETATSSLVTSQVVSPIERLKETRAFKPTPSKGSKELINVSTGQVGKIPLGMYYEATEKPLKTIVTGYAGLGVGKVATSVPSVTRVVGKPLVKYGLLGLTAASVGYSTLTSKEGIGVSLGRQVTSLGAFGTGLKIGTSLPTKTTSIKNIKLRYKDLKVESAEMVKSVTKSKEFGGNVLDVAPTGEPVIASGVSASKGGGLFKVDKNFYKVTVAEKGLTQEISPSEYVLKSKADIKVTGFKYKATKPIQVGRTKRGTITAIGKVKTSDEGVGTVRSMAKMKFGGKLTRRATILKAVSKDDVTNVAGRSFDIQRKKIVGGSLKDVAGQSKLLASYPKGESNVNVHRNVLFGRQAREGLVGVSVKDSSKGLKDFKDVGNVGTIAKGKPINVQSLVSEESLKSAVKSAYIRDVRTESVKNVAKVRGSLKVAHVTVVKPISKPVNFVKYSNIPVQVYRTSPKLDSKVTVSLKGVAPTKQTSKQFNLSSIKRANLPKSMSAISPKLAQEVSVKQVQGLKQKQQVKTLRILRTTEVPKPFVLTKPTFSTTIFPNSLKSGSIEDENFKFPKIKTSKKSFKGYLPSIEASLFNIRGKRISKSLAESGLVLRPVVG